MSNAEELLNSIEDQPTTRSAIKEPIVVDQERIITVPTQLKKIAVQFDHDISTVTFDCPRYWDGIDMSTMNIYINYMRKDNVCGSRLATNVAVDETDTDIMHFDWTISRNATQVKGDLSFLVCIKNVDAESNEINHWNSELNTDMYVVEGLECEEDILANYPDVIADILTKLDSIEGVTQEYVDTTFATKIELGDLSSKVELEQLIADLRTDLATKEALNAVSAKVDTLDIPTDEELTAVYAKKTDLTASESKVKTKIEENDAKINAVDSAVSKVETDLNKKISDYETLAETTYATKTALQEEITTINNTIGNITHFYFEKVDALPSTGKDNIIYLVSKTGEGMDIYDEYLYVTDKFEKIGSTDIDLSGYMLKEDAKGMYYNKDEMNAAISQVKDSIHDIKTLTGTEAEPVIMSSLHNGIYYINGKYKHYADSKAVYDYGSIMAIVSNNESTNCDVLTVEQIGNEPVLILASYPLPSGDPILREFIDRTQLQNNNKWINDTFLRQADAEILYASTDEFDAAQTDINTLKSYGYIKSLTGTEEAPIVVTTLQEGIYIIDGKYKEYATDSHTMNADKLFLNLTQKADGNYHALIMEKGALYEATYDMSSDGYADYKYYMDEDGVFEDIDRVIPYKDGTVGQMLVKADKNVSPFKHSKWVDAPKDEGMAIRTSSEDYIANNWSSNPINGTSIYSFTLSDFAVKNPKYLIIKLRRPTAAFTKDTDLRIKFNSTVVLNLTLLNDINELFIVFRNIGGIWESKIDAAYTSVPEYIAWSPLTSIKIESSLSIGSNNSMLQLIYAEAE